MIRDRDRDRHRRTLHRPSQSGAALLLAMVLVTVVSTLAAGMVWQQWRAVEVEAAERARAQSAWILSGALDWARLILREDVRSGGGSDHLGEPWAVPLAEARLSTFLAAGRDGAATDDGPEAFLSGDITDAQSRYNLRNLAVAGDTKEAREARARELAVLQRLLAAAGLPTHLAATLAEGVQSAAAGVPQATSPLEPRRLEDLAWLGIDAATRTRLAPFVTLLPEATAVNLNTAPREVLAAVIPGLDLGGAQRLVQARERQPFKTLADVQSLLPSGVQPGPGIGVASSYFEVRGRLRLGDQVLEERSLVRRREQEVTALRRERLNAALARTEGAAPLR